MLPAEIAELTAAQVRTAYDAVPLPAGLFVESTDRAGSLVYGGA